MKINPKYGDKIITIPATSVLEYLKEATETELKVLIFALANQNTTLTEISKAAGISAEAARDALTTWKKKGVMSVTGLGKTAKKTEETDDAEKKATKETEYNESEDSSANKSSKVILLSSELPVYSTDQINRILEKNKETKSLIDNCQQVLGKILSVHEVEVILKLIDYLGLDPDYVLLLCIHCANIKKTSLRYIEKTAVALYDSGITEYEALEKYIENCGLAKSREGELRKLFGVGERAWTKKEKDSFLRWATLGLSMELITKAYEITAENTGKYSISYMNTILESWHKAGLTTVEEVEKSKETYKKTKVKNIAKGKEKTPTPNYGNFDTEEFFEAALRRSYGDDFLNSLKSSDNGDENNN